MLKLLAVEQLDYQMKCLKCCNGMANSVDQIGLIWDFILGVSSEYAANKTLFLTYNS